MSKTQDIIDKIWELKALDRFTFDLQLQQILKDNSNIYSCDKCFSEIEIEKIICGDCKKQ